MAIDNIISEDPILAKSADSYLESQPSEIDRELGPIWTPSAEPTKLPPYIPPYSDNGQHDAQAGGDGDIFGFMDKFSKPAPGSNLSPEYFDWEGTGAQTYKNSRHYQQLGFDPNIGQLNEEKYAAVQSPGDVVKRMFGGFGVGLIQGAYDMGAHWGTLASAIGSGDLSKLYNESVLDEVTKKQRAYDNNWHIFQGESTGLLTSLAAGIQGTGHLIGAIGEMAVEQFAIDAAIVGSFGALSSLGVAADISEGARFGVMFASKADKVSQALTSPNLLKKVWNGLANGTKYVGEAFPGFGNTVAGWGKLATKGLGEEGSMMQVTGRGFGNFVRDMRGLNMATSFASGNAAGVYNQMVNDQVGKYKKEHGGVYPDDIEMEAIKDRALRSAKVDGGVNAAGMLLVEGLSFGNLLTPRKLLTESMTDAGTGVWGNIGMKPSWAQDAATAPLYVKNQIKWGNLRASMFKWGEESGNYGQVGRDILRHSVNFGWTMNMMNGIDQGVKAWFNAKYDHNDISIWDGAKIGAESQFTKEGAKTFITGFATGMFMHGMGAVLGAPVRAGINKYEESKVGADKYQQTKNNIRSREEEFVIQGNELWRDPLAPFTKDVLKAYTNETESTLHGVNDQNGFGQGMVSSAGTGNKKDFHDIEDDASREILVKLMRNNLADAWVQRAKEYANSFDQDELTQMFGVDSTPENYKAILANINKLEPRLRDLKDIVRQVDGAFKNKYNPYAKDPTTGERLYPDGSEAFAREWTDWKTHEGMKDYIVAIKDKALRANQRQKDIFYGDPNDLLSTGLIHMPFSEDLGMSTLITVSSPELLQNELNILNEMTSAGDQSAAKVIGPLKEYQDVLHRFNGDYDAILKKGAYPERDADILKLKDRYRDELADKFHKYIGESLTLRNIKGKVIESKPLPGIQDVKDSIDRFMDYYMLQAEEGAVLMKLNSLLDPKISRGFQDIYFREKARREQEAKKQDEDANQWTKGQPEPGTTTEPEFQDAEEVPQFKEQEVTDLYTSTPEGARFTYDNDTFNSIPEKDRDDLIQMLESVNRLYDNKDKRDEEIRWAVQDFYDHLAEQYGTETAKDYPSLHLQVVPNGNNEYTIIDTTNGNKPIDSTRYPTMREANRELDKYVADNHPVIDGTQFRKGEHVATLVGNEEQRYKITGTKDRDGQKFVSLRETQDKLDSQGKVIGTTTTNKTKEVTIDELNKNYTTGKVEPLLTKEQFNPNYPQASIPDAITSVGAIKAGGPASVETPADKQFMIKIVTEIPKEDMQSGNGFTVAIRNNNITPKLVEAVPGNPQILRYTQQFAIELYHNHKLVGYINNPTYYEFRPNNGKGKPKNISALTIDDIKALFKNVPRLSTAEAWQKHLVSTYEQALQFLGKVTDHMLRNNIPVAEINNLDGIVKFNTVYSYDWIKKGEVGATLNEIVDNLGIDDLQYYATENKYIEEVGKQEGDEVVNTNMSPEDEAIAEKVPAIGQLGMYKAVIKLPNGEFHAVHLVPKQMDDTEIGGILDAIGNVKDVDSAKLANEELRKLFITLPIYDEDGLKNDLRNIVISPYIFATGKEPEMVVYINQGAEESGKPIKIGEGKFPLSSIKEGDKVSLDKLITAINDATESLGIPEIAKDNLKVQPTKESILDMETSVSKNLFRDVSLSYSVIDPTGGDRIIETILQKQPQPKSDESPADMYDTEDDHYQPTAEEMATMYDSDTVTPDITQLSGLSLEGNEGHSADLLDDEADDEVAIREFVQNQNKLKNKSDSRIADIEKRRNEELEKERKEEIVRNTPAPNNSPYAPQGTTTPIGARLRRMKADTALREINEKYDAELAKLSKPVPKIVPREFTEQDIEDINTFNKVLKETMPEGLISVGDIDTVAENMANNGVVVGQFALYLDDLGNVKGRIETKANNPGKYHESMHGVLRMLLTDEQYQDTIKRARVENPTTKKKLDEFRKSHPRYSDMTDDQLKDEYQEEFISDEYDKFASGHSAKMKLPWLQRIFNKIKYWIQYVKDLLSNNRMRAMFYEVKTGKYKDAKLQDNQFTRNVDATQAVPMIKTSVSQRIVSVTQPDGTKVDRTNTFDKYLPEQEASQLLNDVSAEALNLVGDERHPDIERAIDHVLDKYADTFNILNPASPAKEHLKSIKDPAIKTETRNNLIEYWNIFNDADNRKVIKQEILHNLHINGLKKQIEGEEYDTEVNEVGDRNADTKFLDKQSGGYGSIGSNIKRDMASTFTTVDKLTKGAPNKWGFTRHADGTPMVQGIDTNAAYAGMLKTLSDTFDPIQAIKKIINYNTIGDNPNTSTYLEKVLRETGFDVDRFNRTGEMMAANMEGANRLNGILSTFMQQNKNYINVVQNKDTKKVSVLDSNRMNVDVKQYSEWSNAFYDKYISRVEASGTKAAIKSAHAEVKRAIKPFEKATNTDAARKRAITDQELTDIANSVSKEFYNTTGTNLHPNYWKYSILDIKDASVQLTPLQQSILDSYTVDTLIEYDTLKTNFLDKLEKGINPFSRGDNESTRTAWEKVALSLATENAKFDEDIDVTSHKNANNDIVYDYAYPSYNTVEIAKLNTPEGIQVKLDDPQTKGSHLLTDPKFLAMKKAILTAGSVGVQETMSAGSAYEGADSDLLDNEYETVSSKREKNALDFSDFLPRDYKVYMLGKYGIEGQKDAYVAKGKFYTVPVSMGINEAKSTHIMTRLPYEERVSQANDVLWKLNDKSKEILYNSVADEVEQIKRAYDEIAEGPDMIEQGKTWIKDFHDGDLKGTKLFRTRELVGDDIAKEIEDAVRTDKDYDISAIKSKIETAIQDNLYKQLNEFIEGLKEDNLITDTLDNINLPEFLFSGYDNEKLNQEVGIRKDSFTRNLANVYMNEYINYMGMSHILYGDMRERVKGIIDLWKRNAGLNATYNKVVPIVGYEDYKPNGKFYHLTFEDDKFTTIWGDKKDRDDGQMYTDPHSYGLMLFGQGKLSAFRDGILSKLSNGIRLTKDEEKELLTTKSAANPLKLIYDDAKVYLKSSVTPLFYEDVATRENGVWVAKEGRERSFNILMAMVEQAKKTGQVVLASPVSVNKGSKENIVDINKGYQQVQDHHFRERDGQFLGNQVDNPTGGRTGVWPVQIGYQIMKDQNADKDYYVNGKKMKGVQVIDKYMDALANRKDRTFINTISSIYEPISNKSEAYDVQFDAGKFMERIHDTLLATGSDSQTMELFSVDDMDKAKYNLNLAPLVEKATQLYLSMFTKGGTQQKVPMVKFTMMSDSGFKIMRRATEVIDGEVTRWDIVPMRNYDQYKSELNRSGDIKEGDVYMDDLRDNVPMYKDGKVIGYYSEALRPYLFDTEVDNQAFDSTAEYMMCSRIPGENAHTNTYVKWVDTISTAYGDTAICSKDVMTRDGHDKDLDKWFAQFFDTYMKEGKRVSYGTADTPEGKLEEFITYQQENNKELRRVAKQLYATDRDLQDMITEVLDRQRDTHSELVQQIIDNNRLLTDTVPEGEVVSTRGIVDSDDMYTYGNDEIGHRKGTKEYWSNVLLNHKNYSQLYNNTKKELIKAFRESTDELQDIVRAYKHMKDIIFMQAMQQLKLPTTIEQFNKQGGEKLNIGTQNNIALSAQMALLSSEHISGGGKDAIINQPTSTEHIKTLADTLVDILSQVEEGQVIDPYTQSIIDRLSDKKYDQNGLLGQGKAFEANQIGKSDVGAIANMIQVSAILNQFDVSVRPGFGINFDGKILSNYGGDKTISGRSKSQGQGTILNMDVDAAKDHLPSRFNLSTEFTGYIGNMVGLGMDETTALLYPLTKMWDSYKREVTNSGSLFGEKRAFGDSWIAAKKKELENQEAMRKDDINQQMIIDYLKTDQSDIDMNYTLLDHLDKTRTITERGARQLSKILRMDNARNMINWEQIDDIESAFRALGVGMKETAFELSDIPYDIRDIITKRHKNIAENYQELQLLAGPLGKKAFISRQNISEYAKAMVLDNFNVPERDTVFRKELMHDWNSYLSLVGLMNYLTKNDIYEVLESMNQDIMWSTADSPKNISSIVGGIRELKGIDRNRFANALAIVKPQGKTKVTQANINTWVKMSEQMQRKLVNSFRDLVASTDENRYKAGLAFFNYLLVAQGGQFKAGSYIRFTPEFLFKDWSDTMTKIIEQTSKPVETEDGRDKVFMYLFNQSYIQTVEKFMTSYSTHIANRSYLKGVSYGNFVGYKLNEQDIELGKITAKEIQEFNDRTAEFIMLGDKRLPLVIDPISGKMTINVFNGIRDNEWVDAGVHGMIRAKKGKYSKVEMLLRDRNLHYLQNSGFGVTPNGQIELPFSIRIGSNLMVLTRVGKEDSKSYNNLLSEGQTVPKGVTAVYERAEYTGDYKQWKAANAVFGAPVIKSEQPEISDDSTRNSGDNLVSSSPMRQPDINTQVTDKQIVIELSKATNYSGDADGGDKEWAAVGKEFGLGKQVNYLASHMDKLTPEQYRKVEDAYRQAAKDLGRPYIELNGKGGKLVRRDYLQAKAGDAVYAISTIMNPGDINKKGYKVKSKLQSVDGGTGYAVQMAINMGKPVHVYDQDKKQWYIWNEGMGKFMPEDTPVLTEKFTGIGTREINEDGKQAIRDVYKKSTQSEQPNVPLQVATSLIGNNYDDIPDIDDVYQSSISQDDIDRQRDKCK